MSEEAVVQAAYTVGIRLDGSVFTEIVEPSEAVLRLSLIHI